MGEPYTAGVIVQGDTLLTVEQARQLVWLYHRGKPRKTGKSIRDLMKRGLPDANGRPCKLAHKKQGREYLTTAQAAEAWQSAVLGLADAPSERSDAGAAADVENRLACQGVPVGVNATPRRAAG